MVSPILPLYVHFRLHFRLHLCLCVCTEQYKGEYEQLVRRLSRENSADANARLEQARKVCSCAPLLYSTLAHHWSLGATLRYSSCCCWKVLNCCC